MFSAAALAGTAAPLYAVTKTLTGTATSAGAVSLTTNANWSPANIPVTTDEAEIPSTYTTANLNVGLGSARTFGDLLLDDNAAFNIGNLGTVGTSYTLSLSGGGGSTEAIADGGATGDLLLAGSAVTSTITVGNNVSSTAGAAGRLNIALLAAGNIDVVNTAATVSITSVVSGTAGTLTKTGLGTLQLSGANTYTGGTVISAGSLRANNLTGLATGTTGISVAAGATLGGAGFTGPVTVDGNITAGVDANSIGTLTTGSETWDNGGNFIAAFTGDLTSNDKLIMTGLNVASLTTPFTVTATGSAAALAANQSILLATDEDPTATVDPFEQALSLNELTLSSGSTLQPAAGQKLALTHGTDNNGNYFLYLTDQPVPEPASVIWIGVGVAALTARRRRANGRSASA